MLTVAQTDITAFYYRHKKKYAAHKNTTYIFFSLHLVFSNRLSFLLFPPRGKYNFEVLGAKIFANSNLKVLQQRK